MNENIRRPNAQDIIDTILQAFRQGIEKFDHEAYLVPCQFEVLLHPDAYKELQPMQHYLKERVRSRLDQELTAMNRSHSSNRLVAVKKWTMGIFKKKEEVPKLEMKQVYQRSNAFWFVDFQPSYDAQLPINYIGVKASLRQERAAAAEMGMDGHQPTRRLTQAKPSTPSVPVPIPHTKPVLTFNQVLGRLSYQDNTGLHQYEITKAEVVIGRYDPDSKLVEVQLHTVGEVSREHCRIHYNSESQTFHIKDMSRYGTLLNHKLITAGYWHPLSHGDLISLAGRVILTFEKA